MTREVMQRLYEFNTNFRDPANYKQPKRAQNRKNANEHPWGSEKVRTMLQCLYIISFICLLRYDEALHIQWHEIVFLRKPNDRQYIQLRLPFRKTHQLGGNCDIFACVTFC